MGCHASKPKRGRSPKKSERRNSLENPSDVQAEVITEVSSFKVTKSALVGENEGSIFAEYELVGAPIGKGEFGEVRKAIHRKTKITRAVKVIYKQHDPKEEEKLINEVNILRSLDHPNIMEVLEFYQDDDYFFIVSDFYDGGELYDRVQFGNSLSEKDAARAMKQILSAIYYCHERNIVHRDLKLENIVYESKSEDAILKIIDFGNSKFMSTPSTLKHHYGTVYYVAPEVLKGAYTEKCDVWSCGVILYMLLSGKPPFDGPDDETIEKRVMTGTYNFHDEKWKEVSPDAKIFIQRMMNLDVNKRYSAEQCLDDPWFQRMFADQEVNKPLALTALKNLKSFRPKRKLQEATWIFLVTYMSAQDVDAEAFKMFQALDRDNDGQITREELVEACKMITNSQEEAEKEAEAIMKAIDSDNSGGIDYTEFVLRNVNRQKLLSKENLEAAFKILDSDDNGYLEVDEIKAIFKNDDEQDVQENVWKDLIKEVDANADGKICLADFKQMMINLL
jgi:calcium-dependent protein kinase